MTTNNNLMQKVLNTNGFAQGGGLLPPEQADRFIDYMWDARVMLPRVRTERMTRDVQEVDKINVGKRILRQASEAADDGINVGVRFTKITLTSTKMRADWELSTDLLEDNLEGAALEEHVARMLTSQIGNDLEDYAINGSKNSSDPGLHAIDGWVIRAKTDGIVVDHAGADYDVNLLKKMERNMPRKYMNRRSNMRYFAGSNTVQNHVDAIGELAAQAALRTPADVRADVNRNDTLGTDAGYTVAGSGGIRMTEVPLMEDYDYEATTEAVGDILLTEPSNLLFGIRRDIKVLNQYNQKTDSIEYTVYTRIATAIEEHNAVVVATNVGTAPVFEA